ncbi:hypothetical protein RBJ15_07885 [Pantoea sp. BS_4]|uniref:hypothetical protein n=1 Tax=Pantoea TaxID=53335 RepID=UPI001562D00A|nr:hypothetical protein [Pantoea stewartii]NRH24675.1 hypothetical protein [Pantoea stewartii]
MTLSRINWDAVAIAMLLLVVMALGVALKLQSSSKTLLMQQIRQLEQEKVSSEAIATNLLITTKFFNQIARATQDDNQTTHAESESRVLVIHKLVKSSRCASVPVPRGAADQLRAHRNKVRSGSPSADTSQFAG